MHRNLVKFGTVWFLRYTSTETDRQTDRHTRSLQYCLDKVTLSYC